MSSNRQIAKNSLFLYFRMFLNMGIGLITAGLVLRTLGITDYGIYNIVGGFVSMFGFLNSSMSSATQRFLSFDIGKGNSKQLHKTFSATVTIHWIIAIIVVIILETFGLWYINYRLNVPLERMDVVNAVFQFSVLSTFFGIIQVPYNALITAHEKFNVYAYISILEMFFKVLVLVLIVFMEVDKLLLYSFLLFITSFIIRVIYRVYCRNNFKESHYKFYYNKSYFSEILAFSGWNVFGSLAAVGRGQGNNLLLNTFFGTAMNAAYGVTYQVSSITSSFVSSFQLAINPQVIKSYANQDYQRTNYLIKSSSLYSYFLMLIIVIPIVFNIDFILEFWLTNVPPRTSDFIILCIVGVMLDVISNPLMTAARATGKMKWYQITISILIMLSLPLSYFALKLTNNPNWVFIFIAILNCIALGFRMFFLQNMMKFNVKEFVTDVLLKILVCTILSVLLNYCMYLCLPKVDSFTKLIFSTALSLMITFLLIFILGIGVQEKRMIKKIILQKIGKNGS